MNGPQHYREAERLMRQASPPPGGDADNAPVLLAGANVLLAAAHVHALLAQVHALFAQHWSPPPPAPRETHRARRASP